MPEEKSLPLPEKELPPPHDMLLEKEAKDGSTNGTPPPLKPSGMTFWDKYGAKKWLLPLLVVVLILFGVVAVAGLTSESTQESKSREERRMERAERKAERQQKRSKKQKQKKRNNKKNASVMQNPTTFTYGSGVNKLTLQYPGDMKVNITTGKAALSTTDIPIITISGKTSIIRMSYEPNSSNLSAANWLAQLAKQDELYNATSEPITVAGKSSVLQHTLSTTANWNAYIPLSGQILWIDMNYGGRKNQAEADFMQLLDTIQLGTQTSITPIMSPVLSPTGM